VVKTFSHVKARDFYDWMGAKQDSQASYEDRATGELIAHARFEAAESAFEFGCGTGRFAKGLLEQHLPPTASYAGVDISSEMVQLARTRLDPFGKRASVVLTGGDRRPRLDRMTRPRSLGLCYGIDSAV
jgi:ubiquinone/menaquinone biosynthesis C-methylase UbiE